MPTRTERVGAHGVVPWAADAALQPNNDPQAMARLRQAIDAAWLNARH